MKLFLPLILLFLVVVVSCKKVDHQAKEKSHAWSEKRSHNVKKYNQEKTHHHEKHQKVHLHKNPVKHEPHHVEVKQDKAEALHEYHDIPKHEAELQKDIKSSKKEIEDRLAKEEQDLHLQDLTHADDPANSAHKNHKNLHEYQKGHHKANHFSHSKGQKTHHHQAQDKKLFDFPEAKNPESKQSHPVLEDSFETLAEEVIDKQPEHSLSKKKDSSKNKKSHKKAYEKVKQKIKNKDHEKKTNKEEKKNKKQQQKVKKEKKEM